MSEKPIEPGCLAEIISDEISVYVLGVDQISPYACAKHKPLCAIWRVRILTEATSEDGDRASFYDVCCVPFCNLRRLDPPAEETETVKELEVA